MKKYSAVILAIMALIIPAVVNAAPQNDERKQFFKEIREFKHKFLARELNLTKEQEQKFFPIYD
ncbi:MAG: hypothetical protein K2F70_05325, partial [Muribaculaceae bacterium]|nr:hypothetical protein [Muribaculaceae bacterium]